MAISTIIINNILAIKIHHHHHHHHHHHRHRHRHRRHHPHPHHPHRHGHRHHRWNWSWYWNRFQKIHQIYLGTLIQNIVTWSKFPPLQIIWVLHLRRKRHRLFLLLQSIKPILTGFPFSTFGQYWGLKICVFCPRFISTFRDLQRPRPASEWVWASENWAASL